MIVDARNMDRTDTYDVRHASFTNVSVATTHDVERTTNIDNQLTKVYLLCLTSYLHFLLEERDS
jgi:hypothetical protein